MASNYSSFIRKIEQVIKRRTGYLRSKWDYHVELEPEEDATDILIQWDPDDVLSADFDDVSYMGEDVDDYSLGSKPDRDTLLEMLSEAYTLVERTHKGFVEEGTSDIDEGVYRIRIHDEIDYRRASTDHGSGSYMSRQNLREMGDMADFIVDDIGNEGLDDWVEDKISQAYSKLNDVARYRGYRDDHPHGEDGDSTFKLADDEIIDDLDSMDDEEIIDDMGIMADFDKESRYSRGEKGREEYAKAKKDGDVPDEFLEYEGAVTSPGEAPDPARVKKNKKELYSGTYEVSGGPGNWSKDKKAHYDIIDDLEW